MKCSSAVVAARGAVRDHKSHRDDNSRRA